MDVEVDLTRPFAGVADSGFHGEADYITVELTCQYFPR